LYCQDWQKEMCTLPPRECLSTGAEATESEICVAPLNVEKTSAPACLVRDGYRVRVVWFAARVGAPHRRVDSDPTGCRGNIRVMQMHEDAPAKASKTATTMNPVGSPPDGGAALPRAGEPVVPSAI